MTCTCGSPMLCIDSRQVQYRQQRRRRYECPACGVRVSTMEITAEEYGTMRRVPKWTPDGPRGDAQNARMGRNG